MNTIEIKSSRIRTIELPNDEKYVLINCFSQYRGFNGQTLGTDYLMNMIDVLGMSNGNSLNVELTMNDLVASVCHGQMNDLMKWARKENKKYTGWGSIMFDEKEMKLLRQFQKAVKVTV